MFNKCPEIIKIILVCLGLSIQLLAEPFTFPRTSHVFLQTNGPEAEYNDGDWWTNQHPDAGNGDHIYRLVVPANVAPETEITIEIYDPESWSTIDARDLDEERKRGTAWDETTFELYYEQETTPLHAVTYPPSDATHELWIPFHTFTVGTNTGIYYLHSRTALDDQNSYQLRIAESDPDGIPNNGDELVLQGLHTTMQIFSGGNVTLWFFSDGQSTLNLFNFDMDNTEPGQTLEYTDPLGNTFTGTRSGDMLWNTGSSELPTAGGDEFVDPAPGWWHADFSMGDFNQFIFYGPPFHDTEPTSPELQLIKDDGVDLVRIGREYTAHLTLSNQGSTAAIDVRVTDSLPEGTEFVSATLNGTYSQADHTVSWTLGSPLLPGESILLDVTFTVLASAPQEMINCALVSFEDALGNRYPQLESCDTNMLDRLNTLISGRVWNDENENGIQDNQEPGMTGIPVQLYNSQDQVIATTMTGTNGSYEFQEIDPGDYYLSFDSPDTYIFTLQDVDDDALDSDANPLNGFTAIFSLNRDEQLDHMDAGLIRNYLADLQIEKSVDSLQVHINNIATFTLNCTNLGPDTAKEVQILDILPKGLDFIDSSPAQTAGPNPLIWNIGDLLPDEEFEITVRTRANNTNLGDNLNQATIGSSISSDPNRNNNQDDITVTVLVPIELSSFSAHSSEGIVKLIWTTESESDNAGFLIYRAKQEKGDYTQITQNMIPGQGNSQTSKTYRYEDKDPGLAPNQDYWYKLVDIDFNGVTTEHGPINVTMAKPNEYELMQNYPNPFNPETLIRFKVKQAGHVRLGVYNMKGQLIRTLAQGPIQAGAHTVVWDGRDYNGRMVPSGPYLYTIEINNFEQTRKMMLLK
ncbi:DUF11 domain-containing protein [candidate division KSB1 bacterium]|nr:DUF11 domain-containing protein [candidate division KSB1 bacterium]